ncbi:MAG: TetR family transcriptional regulator [Chloroflexi bacterium]|nr:TetR family transcriptional regulator [Chloroflexota bacterium]
MTDETGAATRLTLPQRRAQETRERILEAAAAVFARRGYGQATVDEIAAEAEVSMGALYHHFPSKEQLFGALVEEHLRGELMEFRQMGPARSNRELIERFVATLIDHLRSEAELSPSLTMEFWAHAARDDRLRPPVAEFHRRSRDILTGVLRIGQSTGVVRADLDVETAAVLLQAVLEGVAVQQALEPASIDLERLSGPWADMIERFVQGEGEGDVQQLQQLVAGLLQRVTGETEAETATSTGEV